MNSDLVSKIAGVIDLLLESSSRINDAKPVKYWYPLSSASYGREEILQALDSLCTFRTTMWEKTRAFERAFASMQGSADAVMLNSGSSADLLLAFLLVSPPKPRLKPGDEVLIPAVTWPTQIWSCLMAGLKVRLVDVHPATLNVCPDALAAAVGPETRAVFLVHLLGNPCDMDAVRSICERHDLLLIEDCCEALGAKWEGRPVGQFGVGAAFSFFFSHHITTMEGGMVTVPELDDADALRILRAHGWLRNAERTTLGSGHDDLDPRYAFVNWGFNVRPTELQAGFGLEQLKKLPGFADARASFSKRFYEAIATFPGLRGPRVLPKATPSWMALPIVVEQGAGFDRRTLMAHLESQGIETRPIVTGNVARQPATHLFPAIRCDSLPGADEVHESGLYIGINPLAPAEDFARLISVFELFFAAVG